MVFELFLFTYIVKDFWLPLFRFVDQYIWKEIFEQSKMLFLEELEKKCFRISQIPPLPTQNTIPNDIYSNYLIIYFFSRNIEFFPSF